MNNEAMLRNSDQDGGNISDFIFDLEGRSQE